MASEDTTQRGRDDIVVTEPAPNAERRARPRRQRVWFPTFWVDDTAGKAGRR